MRAAPGFVAAAPLRQLLRQLLWRVLLLLPLLLPAPVSSQEPRAVPELTARVTDLAGVLDATAKQNLDSRLAALERDTGSQVAVLLVERTGPDAIEQYSIRVAEAWRLGREEVDDGVLVLVAVADREMRIDVGYGLEGALPDARVNRIIDELILPHFATGDYGGGLSAGIEAIAAGIAGEELPAPEWRHGGNRGGPEIDGILPILLLFGIMIGGALKRAVGALPGAALSGGIVGTVVWFIAGVVATALIAGVIAFVAILFMSAGPGSWSSGRGGGFGGGFGGRGGGFSGGGGSFGGGGASGRW